MDEPTLQPSLSAYLDELTRITRGAVASQLLGAYAVGSTAQRDRTSASDVDVLVVVEPAAQRPWLHPLAEAVVAAAQRSAFGRTEYVVYDAACLAPPRYPLPYVLNVNAGPATQRWVSSGDDPPHWFLLDVAMARQHAIRLEGPPADRLLGAPARPDVARAIVDAVDWHGGSGASPVDSVLNACRAWRFLAGEGWASKLEAGRWATRRWDGEVVARALAARRTGPRLDPLDPGEVRRLLQHVRALARRAAV